jgi:hypothetical protein
MEIQKKIAIENIEIILTEISNPLEVPQEGVQNLAALKSGNFFWLAEIPSSYRSYGYYNDVSLINGELIGWFGGSFRCTIDIQSGKIVRVEFVK